MLTQPACLLLWCSGQLLPMVMTRDHPRRISYAVAYVRCSTCKALHSACVFLTLLHLCWCGLGGRLWALPSPTSCAMAARQAC